MDVKGKVWRSSRLVAQSRAKVFLFQVGQMWLVPLVEIADGFLSGSDLPLPPRLDQKWFKAVKSDAISLPLSTAILDGSCI